MGLNMTALQGMYYLISCGQSWACGLIMWMTEHVHSYFILQVQWVKPVMNIWSEINDKHKKAG